MRGLPSLRSEGMPSLRDGDAPQNEIGLDELLLVLAVNEASGDFESFGEAGELSLIAFSFA